MHPDGNLCATGEVGLREPRIVVWRTDTMKTRRVLSGYHTRGVCLLEFNEKGDKLCSVGMDAYYSLAVYDWDQVSFVGKNILEGETNAAPTR